MLQKPQSELFHKQPCMEQTHSAEKITAKQKQNKKREKKKQTMTRRDIDHTEVPKNLPSLVRARRKGFFGESDVI